MKSIQPIKRILNLFNWFRSSRVVEQLTHQQHIDSNRARGDCLKSKMSTVEELENERQLLVQKVQELVGVLESKKGDHEIKLTKEQVIKSKEERDAASEMEKLDLNETEDVPKQEQNPPVAKKTGEKKPAKARGAPKEQPAPDKPVDISRLDLRIGKIVEVDRHPDADALYVEKIDCGDPTGPRTVISGLVKHVPIEEMRDRIVVVLCNLKPAKMRGILSEAMVMCASTEEKVELIKAPKDARPGDRVVFANYPGEPDTQLNPKKKVWEQVSPDIKTNDQGVAMYKDCEFRLASAEGQFTSNLKNVQIR